MVTFTSHNPAQTMALGESWGRAAAQGLVLGLTGELGAGKTQLVKGMALGLGISARVTSPSFALVNEYRGGRLDLFHLDLYRLSHPDQVVAAGLEDYLDRPPGVAVVEWIERWFQEEIRTSQRGQPRRPRLYRRVLIEVVDEFTRRISYEDSGP
jgi:tRNA threonylcarbamoyladenosine biosynthesis protein TsaE